MAFNITQPPRFLFVRLFISLCYSLNCPRLLPITLPLVPPSSTLSPPSNTPPPPTQKKKEIILKWLCYHFNIEHSSTTNLLVCAVQTQLLWTGLSVVSISFLLFVLFCLATIWQKNAQLKSSTLQSGSGFGSWSLICCALLLGNWVHQPDMLLLKMQHEIHPRCTWIARFIECEFRQINKSW